MLLSRICWNNWVLHSILNRINWINFSLINLINLINLILRLTHSTTKSSRHPAEKLIKKQKSCFLLR